MNRCEATSLGKQNFTEAGEALRIGLMVHSFPVVSETFVSTLAAELLAAGHDLRILATSEDWDEGVDGTVTEARLNDHVARATKDGRLPFSTAARIVRQSPVRAARMLAMLVVDRLQPARLGVTRMCAAEDPFDIVHAQFGWSGLTAQRHRTWGTLRMRALVVHFRGHDITHFVQDKGEGVYSDLFQSADLFIANSGHFRDRALSLGCPDGKIRVIGSPIDTDYFAPPTHARALYDGIRPLRLVAVGRLVEKKGFADAVAALARLRGDGLDARLEIVGDGPLRADLSAQIARLGVDDVVSLAGAGSRETVRAALHRADILLAPSVRAASGDEDAPVNTLKEAMATAMPVVATWHGGIPELVVPGENGLLVPERDSEALADAIARLAGDPASWHRLGTAGRRKVVQVYDRKVILRQTLNAYEDALSHRRWNNE